MKASPEQQATFLEQLFAKDSDLRIQFQKFLTPPQKPLETPPVLSFIDLEKYRKKYEKS